MKKIIVLAVAALFFLPMSAMAGMSAFMDMEKVSDFELAQTTGQTGLTVNVSANSATFTWVSWGDDDGYAPLTTIGGVLYIVPIDPIALDLELTVDVCTSLGTTYLVIEIDSLVTSTAIALGLDAGVAGVGLAAEAGAIAAGPTPEKLGILTIDATMDNIVIMISAH